MTTTKSLYSKRLGEQLSKSIVRNPGHAYKFHVISDISEKWSVVTEGHIRALKVFKTQKGAINFAKKNALKNMGMVIVHKKDGLIRDRISYAEAK